MLDCLAKNNSSSMEEEKREPKKSVKKVMPGALV